jgi:uncharacterized protein (TIGR00375 family)
MDLEHLRQGALRKGLQIMGTGDFTHPLWFKEISSRLEENGDSGLFALEGCPPDVLFMLTCEVSTIYSDGEKVRKVHSILHAPSLEIVEQINEVLGKKGNLGADGRSTFGGTTPEELVELMEGISNEVFVIPAHAWTPWFGVFGSNSGFDSLKEAFGKKEKSIFAIETGMSSDPAMNWRLGALDGIALVSNSDSHSPHPHRIGRECNVFSFELGEATYNGIFDAVRERNPKEFLFTVETDPSYGKYHFDGHRNCGFSSSPDETRKLGGRCPKCKRKLTIGVLNRVEELADRPDGFVPKKAIPFKKLAPLAELVAAHYSTQVYSRKVQAVCDSLFEKIGSEFKVLLEAEEKELSEVAGDKIARIILLNRKEKLFVKPGFDGEYGIVEVPGELLEKEKKESKKAKTAAGSGQKSLGDF